MGTIHFKFVYVFAFLFLSFEQILGYQYFHDNQLHQLHRRQTASIQTPYPAVNQPVVGRTSAYFRDQVKDFVTIERPPKNLTAGIVLKIRYQCSSPQVITTFVDGYEDDDKTMRNSTSLLLVDDPQILFSKSWRCSYTNDPVHKRIKIKLPKRFLYRPSVLMPKVSMLEDAFLKVFMTPQNEWVFVHAQKEVLRSKLHILHERSKNKLRLPLFNEPPFDRPEIKRKRCLSWKANVLDTATRNKLKSVAEEECSTIVRYPIVMSEEPYGVIKGYYPFYNPELKRIKSSNKVRLTLSVEAYLFSYCEKSSMCSFFQHIDNNDSFATPVFLMNEQGNIHVQVRLNDGKSYAHTTTWKVPLNQWVRINFVQTNVRANLSLTYGENFSDKMTFSVEFHKPVSFKESDGYLLLGGSVYCQNLNAIISHAKFCRNKALPPNQINFPNKMAPFNEVFLTVYRKQRQSLVNSVKRCWNFHSKSNNKKTNICIPLFLDMIRNKTKDTFPQCPAHNYKELPKRLHEIEVIIKTLPTSTRTKEVAQKTGEALYKIFLEKLEEQNAFEDFSTSLKLLRQSARLGHSLSHFFLYSIFKNGISVKKNFVKARFHLLAGAQLGDRMCLKAIAYNHLNGLSGFPTDIDLSFFYYFNLAHKTQKDLVEHSEGLASVNMARLTDERQMKEQLSEGDDLFQWIKHQASKGAYSAQRNMGRLLYWGQQGLQRNLNAAFKYYEEAAKGGDPAAMYDYGLVLLKGHGTDADTAKGVEMLRQAAEVQNPSALNTLGWYYTTKEVNMTKAMEYFEKADKLGSIDAAYNLGHTYHTGQYPGKKRDMKMAFTKYYRAAAGGHTEASLQVAYLTATGIEGFVQRNAFGGVQWAKFLTERNPTMGELVREGLQAYRKQHWLKALFMYLSIADTGFEIAQYNTAFLCEGEANDLTRHIEEECMWKNWNISSQMRNAHPYALNKMGDYHYYGYGGVEDLKKSILFYAHAAKLNFPQALFNLATIMEKHGNVIENKTLQGLALPREAYRSPEDTIVHLYKKCTAVDSSETSTPCYIALIRTQTVLMWNQTSLFAKVTTFVVIGITTIILLLINVCRRRRAEDRRQSAIIQEGRLENGNLSAKPSEDTKPAEDVPKSPSDLEEESLTVLEEKEG